MARADLSLEELTNYRPTVAEPEDFDQFWADTLAQARTHDLNVRTLPVEHPYQTVRIQDLTFAGFGGEDVKAWLTTPVLHDENLPVVVEYLGYGGGRELPGAHLHWASAGFAHLLMDTRGQGSTWGTGGHTGDPHDYGPHHPGFMTAGIADPENYYYRRVFTDAVRAVEAARSLPGLDPNRVSINGISQGGGITLAVSGLVPGLVAAMPDVPFLCHYRRAVDIADSDPYSELTRFLSIHRGSTEQVFNTLSYFDGVNFAKRATATGLFSVAIMDKTCPPSTVYAAYHAYPAAKSIVNYEFNGHEGGSYRQRLHQIDWLRHLRSA